MRRWCQFAIAIAVTGLLVVGGCSPDAPTPESDSKPQSTPDFAASQSDSNDTVSGDGWGAVRIGATESEVEGILGAADSEEEFPAMNGEPAVVFRDYLGKGVQVSFVEPEMTVNAIFFFSGVGDHSEYEPFGAGIDKGLNWDSSPEDVLAAFGAPVNDYKSDDGGLEWRRLVYPEVSFRFQNGALETVAVGAD